MAHNGSNCDSSSSLNLTDEQRLFLVSTLCSTAFISAIACSVALFLMIYFKLYKRFTYRLVLYLLVSVLTYSVINFIQLPVAWYNPASKVLVGFCKFIAFSTEYISWNLLLLTLFTVIQLFSLVVCFTELKAIERPYILFSFFVPLLFSLIPFVTDTYGPSGPWCWIEKQDKNCNAKVGIIEQYTLWYGPVIFIMCAYLIAIMIISLILFYRAYKNKAHDVNADNANAQRHDIVGKERIPLIAKEYDNSVTYKTSLKETLPLLAYPVIFFFINILALTDRTVRAITGDSPFWLLTLHAFWNTVWGLFAATTFIIHLAILGKERRVMLREGKHNKRQCACEALHQKQTIHEPTQFELVGTVTATHETEFCPPEDD